MTAWKGNDSDETNGKPRRPYMGHLLSICLELTPEQASKNILLQLLLADTEASAVQEWNEFMKNRVKPILDIQARCLSGVHPLQALSQPGRPTDIAVFEYATRAPGDDEECNANATIAMKMVKQMDLNPSNDSEPPQPSSAPFHVDNRIIDQTVDEEMRLRGVDEDDEDDDMEGNAEEVGTAAPITSEIKAKKEIMDWPDIQPLHVAEKEGLKHMEEAENSNSPWDAPMKASDGPSLEFAWEPSATVADGATDAWADFSSFNQIPSSDNSDNVFFIPSAQHSAPSNNNSLDSEDAPFEFSAAGPPADSNDLSPTGPPPGLEEGRSTGDILMAPITNPQPTPSQASALPAIGSGDIVVPVAALLDPTHDKQKDSPNHL